MATAATNGQPKTIGRFEVYEQEFWTECECHPNLCTHAPDFMRPYYEWTVWDLEREEHAWLTFPKLFVVESYRRKRDAVAATIHALEVLYGSSTDN